MCKKKTFGTNKYLGLTGTILCGICLIMPFPNLFAQQTSVDIPEAENAAVYYLKAFNLLEYPKLEAIKTQLQEIVKNGWQKDYPEIEKVLAENEGCLSV